MRLQEMVLLQSGNFQQSAPQLSMEYILSKARKADEESDAKQIEK
jgi:hypothetical protein